MATLLFRTLVLWMAVAVPAAAETPRAADAARASLIAGTLGAGQAQAALRLQLAPGWHTYWRQPGDAGVPPTFTFDGSTNLAASNVLFPVPTRMMEDGAAIFGYRDDVVFPLQLTPQDARRPIELDVKLAYAICERICVPAQAELHTTISSGPIAAEATAALIEALRQVPKSLSAREGSSLFKISPAAGVTPGWTLTWQGPGPAPSDVFAEAPEGWYVGSQAGPTQGTFVLTASEHPAAARSLDVRLTARGADGAFAWTQHLDISSGGG